MNLMFRVAAGLFVGFAAFVLLDLAVVAGKRRRFREQQEQRSRPVVPNHPKTLYRKILADRCREN
jgi:hypothetical protein